ncbi:hypothetical protein ES708_18120 [subsurface metagenome]
MDKATAIKMLAGTLARGILWGAGLLAAKAGVDTLGQSTVEGIAYFAAALIVAGASAWWSSGKDSKLLNATPPKA